MVASCLLSTGAIGMSARAMLFTGGAATDGGGTIVAKDMEQAVRSHKDIVKGAANAFAKAKKYYEQIAINLCANGHVLDVFACALDQVGLAEMKVCVEKTEVTSVGRSLSRTPSSRRRSRNFSLKTHRAV